jgi:ribosomal protein S18 acetylase RimI-like enzyme
MTTPVAPVPLAAEHLVEAAAIMGRALADDPLFVHVLPDEEHRVRGVPLMMESLLRIGLAQGEVWTTPPPITGVAFWLTPVHPMITDEDREAAGWREVGAAWGPEAFARFKAFAADIGEVAASLPAGPHWRLAWLGVAPEQQGRGIGSALVRQVTARADAEGIACQLFTFAPRNVAIYDHLGFRVTQETILPRSGLRLWVMGRPPRVQS